MRTYTFNVPIGNTGVNFPATISGSVSQNEEYIENPSASGSYKSHSVYGWYMGENVSSISKTSALEQYGYRAAIALDRINNEGFRVLNQPATLQIGEWGRWIGESGQSQDSYADIVYSSISYAQFPAGVMNWTDPRVDSVVELNLITNIPVFETTSEANTYLEEGEGIENAVNYEQAVEPAGSDFEIINMWTHGTWLNDTQPQVTEIHFRSVRAKLVSGKFALYPIYGEGTKIVDGKLKMGISSNAVFTNIEYTTDGRTWTSSEVFPFDFFYRKRTDELGEFDYALTTSNMYIPTFNDENTADGYINGNVGIEQAVNWNEISYNYDIDNYTGDELGSSEFGSAKVQAVFSQQYILDITCLRAIADDLFDTSNGGIWESFKKGLEMYGANPMDAVMGLSFWPLSLSTVAKAGSTVSAEYIWFGGYGWHITDHVGASGLQIIYPDFEIVIGTIEILPSFGGTWRDFEPYSKMYVTLPYCGTYQLDIERYLNKTVQVKYYIDTRTNGCVAVLSVLSETGGWFCTDYFNGQMGINLPISLTNFTEYMNSQMQVLLQGGGQASNTFGSAASSVMGAGGGAALAGAAIGAGAGAGVGGALLGAKTVYGLTQNNINNFNKTKGGSSSMINCFLPQTVDFLFEIQEDIYYDSNTKTSRISEYYEHVGAPSMKPGLIMNFTGFLKCFSVKLECSIATERERDRLKQMLLSGIYI